MILGSHIPPVLSPSSKNTSELIFQSKGERTQWLSKQIAKDYKSSFLGRICRQASAGQESAWYIPCRNEGDTLTGTH